MTRGTDHGGLRAGALFAIMIAAYVTEVQCQIGSLADVCNRLGNTRLPGSDCNSFIECSNGRASLKMCPSGKNFNVKKGQCDNSGCGSKRGLWRQLMPSGGLVGIHCTLVPYTNNVVVWHRGIAWFNGLKPEPGMEQPANKTHEMLSAVLDVKGNRYKGYDVGPPFCSGHTQLPDGSILNCGGEVKGNTRRPTDPEDAINRCRIFKCKNADINSCSWKTIGLMSGNRWYPGQLMFPAYDSNGVFALIMGGVNVGGDPASPDDITPGIDWLWPLAPRRPKWVVTPPTQFTDRMLETNLYPALFVMPFRNNGKFVMFQWAINYGELVQVDNPATNKNPISVLKVLPSIKPNIAITYPAGGCAALHALEPNYTQAKVTFFGGQPGNYERFGDLQEINADSLASNKAYTIELSAAKPSWKEERMPNSATMRTCLTLPNGKILLMHGTRKGRETSVPEGNGCAKEQILSNWIYDPAAPAGRRFTSDPVPNPTFRAYHSCGLVMPDGSLFGAGGDTDAAGPGPDCSGPNNLHYNVDGYVTPNIYNIIIKNKRPRIISTPTAIGYGQTFSITYSFTVTECSLMTPGSNTHVIEQSSRVVILQTVSNSKATKTIRVRTPLDAAVIMPGPHLLFCMNKRDVYSAGVWVTLK